MTSTSLYAFRLSDQYDGPYLRKEIRLTLETIEG